MNPIPANQINLPSKNDLFGITILDPPYQTKYIATTYNKRKQLITTYHQLNHQHLYEADIYVNNVLKVIIDLSHDFFMIYIWHYSATDYKKFKKLFDSIHIKKASSGKFISGIVHLDHYIPVFDMIKQMLHMPAGKRSSEKYQRLSPHV